MIKSLAIAQWDALGFFAENVEIAVGVTAFLLALGALFLEIRYRRRPGNNLELTPGNWKHEAREQHRYLMVGNLEFRNRNPYRWCRK